MILPESEKYFLSYFDRVSNIEGRIIVDPEEIKQYGEMRKLEGEIEILEKFYNIRSTIGIQTTILEKKKQLQEIIKNS